MIYPLSDYLTNYFYRALVRYKPVKGSDEIDVDEIDDVYIYEYVWQ